MNLLEQLRKGKKLKIKHPEYQFTIHADIKLDHRYLVAQNIKITLPQKASKGEKLLLKLVQIYCYDVLQDNFIRNVYESKEFHRLTDRLKKYETRNPLNER